MTEILDFLIVGAGPAGLSAAVEAQRAGIERFLVLEKGLSHSQMIRTFYKEGKRVDARYAGQEAICFGLLCLRDGNRESFLSLMDHVIQSNHLPIRYGVDVWSVVKDPVSGIFSVNTAAGDVFLAKTVVIAIGKMGKPNQPDYWKEISPLLKNNKSILFDINTRPLEGLKVLVVGGGDSACEYAQLLAQKSQVTLSYRRPEFSRANEINARMTGELIEQKQIRAHLPSNIAKIEDDGGRPKVFFKEAQFPVETFDVVLYGLGGMTPVEFLRSSGAQLGPGGEPIVSEIKESTVRGLFIVGDLLGKAQGGGSIISGFNSASAAVRAVLKRDYGIEIEAETVALDHLKY